MLVNFLNKQKIKMTYVLGGINLNFLDYDTNLQDWILVPDIGQGSAKNRAISDENCFITDIVTWCKVKKKL